MKTMDNSESIPILSPTGRKIDDDVETQVYKRRWWIMAVFNLTSILQTLVWNTWGPIAESSEIVLGWNDGLIALLTNLDNISYVLSVIPMTMYMDVKGLRLTMLICSACMLVGTGIRCVSIEDKSFTAVAEVCAFLNGIAGTIPFSGPSLVAAVWFPPNQRTSATAIASFFNYFGIGLAFLVGPLVVTNPEYDTTVLNTTYIDTLLWVNNETYTSNNIITSKGLVTNVDVLKAGIQNLMYIHCAFAGLLFLLILLYLPSKPPKPPSKTAAIQRTSYKATVGQVLRNGPLWLIVVAFSLPSGVTGNWSTVLDVNIKPLGVSQVTAGWMGFFHTLCGCVSGLVVARFSEIFSRRRKRFLVVMLVLAIASSLWFSILCEKIIEFNLPSLYAACLLIGIFMNGTIPLFYEMAVECSYPVAEGVTGGLITLGNCICGSVFLAMFSVPGIGTLWMNWCLMGTFIITLPIIIAFPERYKRSDIDLN